MRYNQYRDAMVFHPLNNLIHQKDTPNNWSSKYFSFKNKRGVKRKYPISNHWLYERTKDIGMNELRLYEHFNENGEQTSAENSKVYIHTSIHTTYLCDISYTIYFSDKSISVSFFPRTNREITKDSIVELVFKHIEENHMYPKGKFRDIQKVYWVSKDYALKIIRDKTDSIDYTREWIENKYNIFTRDSSITNRDLYRVAITKGRQEEFTEVCRLNISSMLNAWEFDGDVDDAENALWEAMSELDKTKIFI